MAEMMNFPDGWHDFIKSNSFVDREKIYTNGVRLMTELRVEQLVEHILREKEQKWVSVKDRLPEEHESIFSRFKGSERWSKAMWVMESKIVLVVAAMPDKGSTVTTGNLHDGKWCTRISPMIDYKVTHWMPLPEPPKEDEE